MCIPYFIIVCFPVSIGKNQALKGERPKWKSDIPLTEGQLTSKREEFWDTAPVFEVRLHYGITLWCPRTRPRPYE